MNTYTLEICGLKRELPIVHISDKTRLANFSFLGDVELVDCLSDIIAEKLSRVQFDYLVGTEVKTVPFIHGVAKRIGHKRFVVCRKSIKPYMVDPTVLKPLDYFPKHVKPLVINGVDRDLIKGKRVVIIDDVVSTGVTLRMMRKLMEKIGVTVVLQVAVIKQGTQFDDLADLVYLAELPIFLEK